MSSDEEQVLGSEEEEEEDDVSEAEEESAPQSSGPTEAQLAMERRRAKQAKLAEGLDEADQEVLEQSRLERERMEEEINELRLRSERRKKEREAEEKRLAVKRAEEDSQRRALEEEKAYKKREEEKKRQERRDALMAEFEKRRAPKGRNFVIKKKEGGDEEEEEEEEDQATKDRKSKEQQEQEKRAILGQRIKEIKYDELDNTSKLVDKAKELHSQIIRLESEKYDLEKRFKSQQYDMMELAERARQMNQVGKQGSLKRITPKEDEVDKIQERFAGAPSRIEMFSRYERQKDNRTYGDRHEVFHGPTWCYPAARIVPKRIVRWEEDSGLPIYEEMAPGQEQVAAE